MGTPEDVHAAQCISAFCKISAAVAENLPTLERVAVERAKQQNIHLDSSRQPSIYTTNQQVALQLLQSQLARLSELSSTLTHPPRPASPVLPNEAPHPAAAALSAPRSPCLLDRSTQDPLDESVTVLQTVRRTPKRAGLGPRIPDTPSGYWID